MRQQTMLDRVEAYLDSLMVWGVILGVVGLLVFWIIAGIHFVIKYW